MAGRKRSDAAKPAGEGQVSQPDTGPGDIAVDEQFTDDGPSTPSGAIRVRGADDEPKPRFGGHVLTEHGWVHESKVQ